MGCTEHLIFVIDFLEIFPGDKKEQLCEKSPSESYIVGNTNTKESLPAPGIFKYFRFKIWGFIHGNYLSLWSPSKAVSIHIIKLMGSFLGIYY